MQLQTIAELHIIPEEIRLDFIALQRYFEENGVTHSFMTTQVGKTVCNGNELRELQYLSMGGREACSHGAAEGL